MQSVSSQPIVQALHLVDATQLRRIFKRAVATDFNYFPQHYQRQVLDQHKLVRLASAVLRPDRLVLGAKRGKELVGFMIGSRPRRGAAQVYWLYVDPAWRGSGLGGRLLGETLQRLKAAGSHQVALATHKHKDYYAKKGFKQRERQEQFPGIDMYIMSYDFNL